mmetsp:Transcript_61279/g.55270  ORF Transcript_61279/g.55270 Transcript_61279/m.55270 type:complete len:606 (+) Transcript_61279:100-1917(+)
MIYIFIGTLLAIGANSQDLTCGTGLFEQTCNATRGEIVCVDYAATGTEICGYCTSAQDCNDNTYWTDNYNGATNLECRDLGAGIDVCIPPACTETTDCTGDGEVCLGSVYCVDPTTFGGCTDKSDCSGDESCYTHDSLGYGVCINATIPNINTTAECSSNKDCTWSSWPVCAYGTCVECMETSDCTNNTRYGEGYECTQKLDYYTCEQTCTSDADCEGNYANPACNETSGICVTCMDDDHCTGNDAYGAGYVCKEYSWGGGSYCDYFCTSNDDCIDEWRDNYCNKTSGDCVECLEDANCEDYDDSGEAYICQSSSWSGGYCTYPSSLCDEGDDAYCIKYFGDDYSCQGNAYLEDYYYCSDEVSPFCEPGDDDCATRFGDGYECLEDPFSGYSYCSNETSPFCTKSIDCLDYSIDSDSDDLGPLFSVFDYDCESVTVPVNISGTITEFPVNVCLPQDQCSDNDDCLTGSECQEYDADGVYSWKMCMLADNTCTDGGDECKAIDSSLECYVAEGRCYLPCNPDNKNGDCDVEQGWFCQSPEDDIWGCLPLGIENVTRVETEDPTPAPTAEPTAEPESGEPGYNEGSASHLTIFGGMFIIMIKYILFM